FFCLFFFSSRRRHTRSKRDWSSDVCSSDLIVESPTPSTTRRRMAFATAVFEGEAELEGVRAERVDSLEALKALLLWGKVVPVFEIGRASCRERVWMWVVDAAVTNSRGLGIE